MSVYSYPESRVIDQVTFRKTANGGIRAYLHARDGADPSILNDVTCALRDMDCQCIPYMFEGKPTLEVRGFKLESRFVKELSERQWTGGAEHFKQSKEDKLSLIDKLRKRSLQASGWLYSIGDINFFLYGLKGKSLLDMAAGVNYGLPTPVLMAYGRNEQSEFQVKDIARKMATHLKEASATLPDSCSLQSIAADHKKGLIKSTSDLLQRYPSEFMNLCYAAAGGCILAAACKHLKHGKPKEKAVEEWTKHLTKTQPAKASQAYEFARKNMVQENWLNAGVGISTIASTMFGTLVKEKKADPDAPKKPGLAGVWEWLQERPLSVTGAGLMVSTLLHAGSTMVAMRGQDKEHKKAVPFRAAFVIASLLAELMVAISSKGHGEGVVSDTSVDDSAIALAADLVARQPKGLQNALIDSMGTFLGRQDVLSMKNEEVTDKLRMQVEAMRDNPWAQPPAEKSAAPGVDDKPQVAAWQAKTSPVAAPQPLLR